MPFSHHSHSGQFCGHAENQLEEIVQTAIAKKMDVYAMTEHMPRREKDLYPEEASPDLLVLVRSGKGPQTCSPWSSYPCCFSFLV